MAIQISGTTVVNNSRQLQNIASLDSTTTATIASAAGGGSPVISWGSPQQTFTSSGSWSIPGSIGQDDYIMFYLVGGGGSGRRDGANPTGGAGGSATLINAIRSSLPSSVSFTIGAGGVVPGGSSSYNSIQAGGDTTLTISGRSYFAGGGDGGSSNNNSTRQIHGFDYSVSSGHLARAGAIVGGGKPGYESDGNFGWQNREDDEGVQLRNSVFGGAAGGMWVNYVAGFGPGTSTYGGNGGTGGTETGTFGNGAVPGGGGGATESGAANGGNGNLRIYY